MTIEGSIGALGNTYVLGLNAVNCGTGEAFVREQVTAEGKEKVLGALDTPFPGCDQNWANHVPHSILIRYRSPKQERQSLEALQAFSRGEEGFYKGENFASTMTHLERAVSLDPVSPKPIACLGHINHHVSRMIKDWKISRRDMNSGTGTVMLKTMPFPTFIIEMDWVI